MVKGRGLVNVRDLSTLLVSAKAEKVVNDLVVEQVVDVQKRMNFCRNQNSQVRRDGFNQDDSQFNNNEAKSTLLQHS